MQTLKTLLPYLLLLVVSVAAIVWLAPVTHPSAGLELPMDATTMVQHSRTLLHEIGVNDAGLSTDVQFQINRPLLQQAQRTFGVEQSNLLIRDSIPAYFWTVHWKKVRMWGFSMGNEGESDKQGQDNADLLRDDINFQFDPRGNILEFSRKVPDSLHLPSLPETEAKTLAVTFLVQRTAVGRYGSDTISVSAGKRIQQPFRTDYEFTWTTETPVLHDPVEAKITVAGNIVSRFEADSKVPSQYNKSETDSIFTVVVAILYVIVGIAMVVIAFRRFRSYEIGFRLAVIIGVVAGILSDIEIFLSIRSEMNWEILIPLILIPLFTGGALILIWAVCETVVRESWKEKFITLDLVTKGHFTHPRIGTNIVRGISLGLAGFALWLILVASAGTLTHVWTTSQSDNALHTFDLSSSWLYVLGHGIYSTLYVYTFCILFVVSLLRRYISSGALLVAVGSIVLGTMNPAHLHPFEVGSTVSVLVSAVVVWAFYRHDALAAFLALFVFNAAQETAGLFLAGNPTYFASGMILVLLGGGAFVVAAALAFRKDTVSDFDEIAPSFARHITERQRLQQEIEIARDVQMSFLPKKYPVNVNLDIAARCAPALEVGGDYYDFIDLGNQRVGVAIGDVSGKGTQAAFFMTLTKGFLNALAQVAHTPSDVLTRVNTLFYQNVERGVFISMVYAIFDTKAKTVTLSRAGHNPVIMRKRKENKVQVVNPLGLALGLDQGARFSKSIEEVRTTFHPGDLFVFYTDGFPEATNTTMEEFGEQRLLKTVEKYSEQSAAGILEGVFKDMKAFTGKAKQHDDMTMVVVKIT